MYDSNLDRLLRRACYVDDLTNEEYDFLYCYLLDGNVNLSKVNFDNLIVNSCTIIKKPIDVNQTGNIEIIHEDDNYILGTYQKEQFLIDIGK